jgi:4-amino-4-deoxy-L-arabinose transferase-like glycosyltransferase
VGLAIRLATVFGRPHRVPGGDAYYYHSAANLLVAGKGFINPFLYYGWQHQTVPTAAFPPGFVFLLAPVSLVGLKSFFAHRIWCCVIGAGAIAVCGLTGREIAGRRAGLIAAFLIAVYPNIWMSDELGMSETLTPLVVSLVLLTAYRFWRRPGWSAAAWLGVSIGVAALARDELGLLAVFILVPLALTARLPSWGRRGAVLAVGALSALLVVAPWVGYNLSRFEKPVFVSSGLGVTLASANCDILYSGRYEGYWAYDCALAAPVNPRADESVQGAEAQTYALHFVRTHEGRVLPVEMARLGRAFGFFHPIQQMQLDSRVETRPYRWTLVGLGMYYAMLPLSIGGAVILRRRRVPILPLIAVGLDVVVSTLITFGDTRYRTAFEVSLVLLSAVMVDWMWTAFRGETGATEGPAPPDHAGDRTPDEQRAGGPLPGQPADRPSQLVGDPAAEPSGVAGPARSG